MKDFLALLGTIGAIILGIVILTAIGALAVITKMVLFFVSIFIIGAGFGCLTLLFKKD